MMLLVLEQDDDGVRSCIVTIIRFSLLLACLEGLMGLA